jgi:hypothetical protein
MYRLYIGYGKDTCNAVFDENWKNVNIDDVDVLEFYTKSEGWKFIRNLQKSREEYCFLTINEYRQIEAYNIEKAIK